MPKFRVEVSNTTKFTYEVEAKSRSDIHEQFDAATFDGGGIPENWKEVNEDDGFEEITFIRDL
jgi:hypothetical protein